MSEDDLRLYTVINVFIAFVFMAGFILISKDKYDDESKDN
jgi:hypothetical protein